MPQTHNKKRPDGLFQVSLSIGRDVNGKLIRKSFYGHTRSEAIKKRDAYKLHMHSDFDQNITVSEWIDIYKETYRQNINVAYLAIDAVPYNRLASELGWKRMADIKEIDLQMALNKVSGKSFSTVNKYAQCIRRVFLRAKQNKIITDNPAEFLSLPPSSKGTHRTLERWEVDLIINNWNNPNTSFGIAVMLMLLCGLRRGEMMALDWNEVDLVNRTITVKQVAVIGVNQATIEQRAKTDAGLRIIPVCQTLYMALSSIPEDKRFGYVCRSSKGFALSQSATTRGLEHFCTVLTRIANGESANNPVRVSESEKQEIIKRKQSPDYRIVQFRNHDLRHTFATALYDAGVDVKTAQYFLGHADIRMTLGLYTHLSRERSTESQKQMFKLFDNWIQDKQHPSGNCCDILLFNRENSP